MSEHAPGPTSTGRASHASLDLAARSRKAAKVRALLEGTVQLRGARVLEVGTGAGMIAATLAGAVGPEGEVVAVDVVDERQVDAPVRFERVTGTVLPFDDAAFDVVVTNHVIEHVGDRSDQLNHLREVARVLRPGGWAYLAMPNRWAPVEPHFHLPLLSWLPRRRRDGYVRLARRGPGYDCDPLTRSELVALAAIAGLALDERTLDAIRVMRRLESPGPLARLALGLPTPVLRLARPALPTLIFLCRRV